MNEDELYPIKNALHLKIGDLCQKYSSPKEVKDELFASVNFQILKRKSPEDAEFLAKRAERIINQNFHLSNSGE